MHSAISSTKYRRSIEHIITCCGTHSMIVPNWPCWTRMCCPKATLAIMHTSNGDCGAPTICPFLQCVRICCTCAIFCVIRVCSARTLRLMASMAAANRWPSCMLSILLANNKHNKNNKNKNKNKTRGCVYIVPTRTNGCKTSKRLCRQTIAIAFSTSMSMRVVFCVICNWQKRINCNTFRCRMNIKCFALMVRTRTRALICRQCMPCWRIRSTLNDMSHRSSRNG
mmetsp:Transcript_6280/g.9961  ORF Transcript_6280/g.9961 Transcript_6280/m.9961 type:complete len:225 (+) Transcript_6280:160-834(+)